MTEEIKKENIINDGRGDAPGIIPTAPPSINTPEIEFPNPDNIEDTLNQELIESHRRIKLASYNGNDKVINSYEANEAIKLKPKNPTILTDMTKLDDLTGGFKAGEIILMSGQTGMGKTTFAKSLTYNLCCRKVTCLWFTFEVCLEDFITTFPHLPLFYLPQEHIAHDLKWIEDRIIETKMKYDIDNGLVTFLDHLHYLVKFSHLSNISFIIGGIMRELKKMAIKHNIVIVLIAHTTKVSPDEQVDISNIRDSSFCAQESDFVCIIRRNGTIDKATRQIEYSPNEGTLHLLKNRRTGRLGTIKLLWSQGLFIEL